MKNLEENIINIYAEAGRQWLDNLSSITAHFQASCGLSNLIPFTDLSYSYVLSGFQGLQPIVLKLNLDNDALKREALALRAFSGGGAVKILAEQEGMLLLERAVPGISLKTYFPNHDEKAIFIACECLKKLHQAVIPNNHQFPHIKDWLRALDRRLSIPIQYLNKARDLRNKLIVSSRSVVLLHGDLHHDNILQNNDDWVVIDPKGIIGDPAYEVAAFIRNPLPKLLARMDASKIIEHRICCFANILKLSSQRILDWCYVQAVLAWAWALEDGGEVIYLKKLAKLFNDIHEKYR